MLKNSTEQGTLIGTWDVFVEDMVDDGSGTLIAEERQVGETTKDGVTFNTEFTNKEITDADGNPDEEHRITTKPSAEFKLYKWSNKDLELAIVGASVKEDATAGTTTIDITPDQFELTAHAKKYIVRKRYAKAGEINEIAFYRAINVENFNVTLKAEEETTIPFKLKTYIATVNGKRKLASISRQAGTDTTGTDGSGI